MYFVQSSRTCERQERTFSYAGRLSELGMEYERIFSNRRTWQKFIKDMCESWHLGYYGRAQGFYVSFALSGTGIKKQIETKKKKLNEAMGKAEE